ncbi:MAG: ribosome maturation factor RimP [Oscillospiraceae bacterium]|nr:ribosome maturation factor RimP [Oscillospiraceae bacterium]
MAKKNTVTVVTELVAPVAEELGLILWDVRFEKEGASWYLRIFIDKPEGVDINDCEAMSRRVSPMLDEADPIPQSYCLEVSSPGIERDLRQDWHFEQYLGWPVNVRLIRPVEGVRDFIGELSAHEDGKITVLLDEESEMVFNLDEAAYVRLHEEEDFDMGGLD